MEIRYALPSDKEIREIQSLINTFYFVHTKTLIEDTYKRKLIVAVEEGKVLGTLLFSFNEKGSKYKIMMLIVRKDLRGKGIGRSLFEYFLNSVSPKPAKIEATITLSPDRKKLNSSEFWSKLGFKQVDKPFMTKLGNWLVETIWIDPRLLK